MLAQVIITKNRLMEILSKSGVLPQDIKIHTWEVVELWDNLIMEVTIPDDSQFDMSVTGEWQGKDYPTVLV